MGDNAPRHPWYDRTMGLRCSFRMFSVVPTSPDVFAAVGRAMAWAPAVGLVLASVVAPLLVLVAGSGPGPTRSLLASFLSLGVLAMLTRGVHLDGLADTADGLGCFAEPERGLAVMRQSDIGPFGVTALITVLGVQATALGHAIWLDRGPFALIAAVAVGRLAMVRACLWSVPAARPEGIGAAFAGSVSRPVLGAWTLTAAASALVVVHVASPGLAARLGVATVVALAASEWLLRRAVQRFGGVTGDVLGAVCEVATTAALIALAV